MKKPLTLGIIPSRSGSKGVPKKNIKLLGGKPLLAWTIEEAKKSKRLTRLVLSTDSKEIARIGGKYGAEVPFLRPADLARDDSPTIDAIKHCLDYLRTNENYRPDAVVILQPTTPFRKAKDIDNAIDLYFKHGASAVVSVSKVPAHFNPEWQLTIESNGLLAALGGIKLSDLKTRRQLLKDTYYRNGEIYVVNPRYIIDKNTLYGDKVMPILTGGKINIDTAVDFEYAEFLIVKRQKYL